MSHNSLALLLIRTVWPERMNMTSVDDAGDLDRIKALAAAAGLPVEQYLQAALTAHTRRKQQRATGSSSLYQRIRCRRSPETGEDDQRTSGMTISEVRVLLSS